MLYFKLTSVLVRAVSNDSAPQSINGMIVHSQVMYDWKADIQVMAISRYSVMGIILFIVIINIIITFVVVIIVIIIIITDKHRLNYSLKPLFFILKLVNLCF